MILIMSINIYMYIYIISSYLNVLKHIINIFDNIIIKKQFIMNVYIQFYSLNIFNYKYNLY